MKKIIHIIIFLIIATSCVSSEKEVNKVNEIELGMTVEKVINTLDIESSDLQIIQEPPLIYRGINAILKDSTEIGISFERTPANHNDLSQDNGLKIVGQLRINGFAWKKKSGEDKIIGERPQFWDEKNY